MERRSFFGSAAAALLGATGVIASNRPKTGMAGPRLYEKPRPELPPPEPSQYGYIRLRVPEPSEAICEKHGAVANFWLRDDTHGKKIGMCVPCILDWLEKNDEIATRAPEPEPDGWATTLHLS